jgi:hypothetical protein
VAAAVVTGFGDMRLEGLTSLRLAGKRTARVNGSEGTFECRWMTEYEYGNAAFGIRHVDLSSSLQPVSLARQRLIRGLYVASEPKAYRPITRVSFYVTKDWRIE